MKVKVIARASEVVSMRFSSPATTKLVITCWRGRDALAESTIIIPVEELIASSGVP